MTHTPFILIPQILKHTPRSTRLTVVGGAIRDGLLKRPFTDLDLVVDGDAEKTARRAAEALSGRLIILDETHAIYRVALPEQGWVVDFAKQEGKTLEQDLSRRDFTINALARRLDIQRAPLIDLFGGLNDLKRGRIRSISRRNFEEDPLRLLRAFRFAAQLDFQIDPPTLKQIRSLSPRLKRSAPERIREEFLKLLRTEKSGSMIRIMDQTGLYKVLFPEAEEGRRVARSYYPKGGVLGHSFDALDAFEVLLRDLSKTIGPKLAKAIHPYLEEEISGYPRQTVLKLGILFHDIGKPGTAKRQGGRLRFFGHEALGAEITRKIATRIRLSGAEGKIATQMVRHHMRPGSLASAPKATDKAIGRFFRELETDAVGMLLVSLADHFTYIAKRHWGKNTDPVERLTRKMFGRYFFERARAVPQRLIDGNDLMRLTKLPPGPRIGELLSELLDLQLERKVVTKEDALRWARAQTER